MAPPPLKKIRGNSNPSSKTDAARSLLRPQQRLLKENVAPATTQQFEHPFGQHEVQVTSTKVGVTRSLLKPLAERAIVDPAPVNIDVLPHLSLNTNKQGRRKQIFDRGMFFHILNASQKLIKS